jgi:tRNA 2-thiouridine synthesizing protein A
MIKIDTRGLSCPQPVVKVNSELKKGTIDFEVLLDSEASRENVARLLNKNQYSFKVREENEYTVFSVKK